MTAKLSLFMPYLQFTQQIDQLLKKKFLDSMFSLESDEMTVLGPNES